MSDSYTCCQCSQRFYDDYEIYKTFADSWDTIGDSRWRLCKGCSDSNNRKNNYVYLFIFFVIIYMIYK
jgi:hypothetical protein